MQMYDELKVFLERYKSFPLEGVISRNEQKELICLIQNNIDYLIAMQVLMGVILTKFPGAQNASHAKQYEVIVACLDALANSE